jgi:hypothetical protein
VNYVTYSQSYAIQIRIKAPIFVSIPGCAVTCSNRIINCPGSSIDIKKRTILIKLTIMKKILAFVFTSLLTVVLFSCQKTGNNEMADTIEELREVAMDIRNENYQDYLQFKADAEEKIKENDHSSGRLRYKKYAAEGKDPKHDQKIDVLKERNRLLKVKLNSYQDGDRNNWAQFKREFNHDMDELCKAFKDLDRDNEA